MTVIVINLERGPEGQPVGRLRKESGRTVPFTGWLDLVRVLEDELLARPGSLPAPALRTTTRSSCGRPGAPPPGAPAGPSHAP